jgi:tRNA G18 (ribose-2'-O)-methylase SpoU
MSFKHQGPKSAKKDSGRPQGKPSHARGKPNSNQQKPGQTIGRQHERDRSKQQTKPSPLSPQEFIVEGQSSVLEYVRFRPDSIIEIYSNEQATQDLARELKSLQFGSKISDIAALKEVHNVSSPVAAKITLKALELHVFEKRIESRSSDLVLILDHLEDPRNLGAIVRSAGFFGVREIIIPDRRQVFITQSAVATAQGGFAVCDLVVVPNLVRFAEKMKKDSSYWLIGADMEGEHFSKLTNEYSKVLLVVGSEGSGMSRMMREACDRIAMIPGKPGALESLNVSVAAGILLSAFSSSTAAL